ncbi:triphosphoribosyl-dephospho-CoA synthase [Salicibibacter cibi]|uniref:triphosphoribosyl-dephospho-CoA synthase n=2 Tax=Salicibibacter cibi TaxID=2743001 RepID=A0A7T6ZEL7_9BACI|nr:triphosphoribosyl-dephospho-CoA synthase [Salicibibacter cibi]
MTSLTENSENQLAKIRSKQAVDALLIEAQLTPKPGLVDSLDTGTHSDMNLAIIERSARSLEPAFSQMVNVAHDQIPSQNLREEVARIGREGEKKMFRATNGVNTHTGAIWAIGLLTSASVFFTPYKKKPGDICRLAGKLASYPDERYTSNGETHGDRVKKHFQVSGARGEAMNGFPHVINIGLPTLTTAREKGYSENEAQLHVLIAIMAALDDTCILYRGGKEALQTIQVNASKMMKQKMVNHDEIQRLNVKMIELGVSPGGSADLLAATVFLDIIKNQGG